MNDARPDADAVLARLKADEARARRGRLKIFFGATAGVGKTFAMLKAAQTARADGVDVVAGVVETHARADTAALLDGLELLPPRGLDHDGRVRFEFDLDAALARRPALLLVDELAHSNAPGSRHPKRWQDVDELLDAGIDVDTTLNVQHLESLNDIVSGIAGIRVRETLPDHVFDAADEIVMVDLPPDELLERLRDGKIYIAEQARSASSNFFRKGNLLALRELALRRAADRVDDQMLVYRRDLRDAPVWAARDAILACIGPDGGDERVLRVAARLAGQLNAHWHAVYVETPRLQRLTRDRRQRVLDTLRLAESLGARTAVLAGIDPSATITRYAVEHNLSRIVIGRRPHRAWPWRRSLAEHIARATDGIDLLSIAIDAPPVPKPDVRRDGRAARSHWPGAVAALGIVALVTIAALPFRERLETADVVMLYLLGVVIAALRFGRISAVLASVAGVLAFDFFFVEPRGTLAINDTRYLVTFVVMLVVALGIGQLTASLRWQARVAQAREARMRRLYEMSRDLSAALHAEQIVELGARFLQAEFRAAAVVLLPDAQDHIAAPLLDPSGSGADVDLAIAQWAHDRRHEAGCGTDTLPAGDWRYVPLVTTMRSRGVLAIRFGDALRTLSPEQQRTLELCASLLAIAFERVHYIEVAQQSVMQMESERLRNSLLQTISHDLRTPLALLRIQAETLERSPDAPRPIADLAQAMGGSVRRMTQLVENLLDMARLQAGPVRLDRQWLPFDEVVGSALAELEVELAGRKVTVTTPADLPLLHVDPVLFQRVLVNLLENIVKYTPRASPVALSAQAHGERIEIRVDDTGPGLPPGLEASVFDKFVRGRREDPLPGAGLGLAICRAIVEAHEGSIRGETRADGGARFTIALPVIPAPPIEEAP